MSSFSRQYLTQKEDSTDVDRGTNLTIHGSSFMVGRVLLVWWEERSWVRNDTTCLWTVWLQASHYVCHMYWNCIDIWEFAIPKFPSRTSQQSYLVLRVPWYLYLVPGTSSMKLTVLSVVLVWCRVVESVEASREGQRTSRLGMYLYKYLYSTCIHNTQVVYSYSYSEYKYMY